jgi:hypothetical protein
MMIGHYAVALAAKPAAPKVSLGLLAAAAVFLDLIWPLLLQAGLEQVAVVPGITVVTPMDFISYPWSHSLLMSLVWGVLFGGSYLALTKDRRGALVLALLVTSHWILDFVVHRPDMPLTPGDSIKLGLGLWNSLAGTLIVELGLFALGAFLYAGATQARDGIGRWGLIGVIVFLLLVYASVIFGPPPPTDTTAIVIADAAQLLFLVAMGWVDRHRRGRG